MQKVREWYVNQALLSVSTLNQVLGELTVGEIMACLDLESQSDRRKSIIVRLIKRAVKLNEIEYAVQLQERYAAAFCSAK